MNRLELASIFKGSKGPDVKIEALVTPTNTRVGTKVSRRDFAKGITVASLFPFGKEPTPTAKKDDSENVKNHLELLREKEIHESVGPEAAKQVRELVTQFSRKTDEQILELDGILTKSALPFWKGRFKVDDGTGSDGLKRRIADVYNRSGLTLPAGLQPEYHVYYGQVHQPTHQHGLVSSLGRHLFVNAQYARGFGDNIVLTALAHEVGHSWQSSYEVKMALNEMIGAALAEQKKLGGSDRELNDRNKKFFQGAFCYLEMLADRFAARKLGDTKLVIGMLQEFQRIGVVDERIKPRIESLKRYPEMMAEK